MLSVIEEKKDDGIYCLLNLSGDFVSRNFFYAPVMPKTQEILNGLQSLVNQHIRYAIFWHIVFYIMIIAFLAKWEPSNRTLAIMLCVPVLSVAVFAWISGNPFNGILFSLLTILFFVFGTNASAQPVSLSQQPYMIAGIIMIVFGLIYPHFIETTPIIRYLYASPAGLIPCPTLSILIGCMLLFNGLGSNALTLMCILFGLFYGIFGALKLAVHIDLVLVFGTLVLGVKYILSQF